MKIPHVELGHLLGLELHAGLHKIEILGQNLVSQIRIGVPGFHSLHSLGTQLD